MAIAVHQDLGGDEDTFRPQVPGIVLLAGFQPLLNEHRHAVGHLLAGLAEDLLPDELRSQGPFGLVREDLLGVGPAGLGGVPVEDRPEGIQIQAHLGANGNDLLEGEQLLVGGDLREQTTLGQQVDLIQQEVSGPPQLAEALGQGVFPGAQIVIGVHHPEEQVGFFEGLLHMGHHAFVHGMLGQVDARCVEEGQLHVAAVHDAQHPGPGGLGNLARGRQLLPQQGVQQGGFSGVGKADDGEGGVAAFTHGARPAGPHG